MILVSDAGRRIASPLETIRRVKFTPDAQRLAALCRQHAVGGLVVGLPLNMDGSESPRSQSARAYARNLAVLGLPILLWDERWSTQAAARGLIEQDMSRAKRAERIDSAAAATIAARSTSVKLLVTRPMRENLSKSLMSRCIRWAPSTANEMYWSARSSRST